MNSLLLPNAKTTPSKLADFDTQIREISQDFTYSQPECSVALPYDSTHLDESQKLLTNLNPNNNLKYVFLVGIGGSNLGTQAVFEALYGLDCKYGAHTGPQLISLDTTHNNNLHHAIQLTHKIQSTYEFLIIIVSKSGGTTETVANAEIIMQPLVAKFGTIASRVVVITDPKSKLENLAKNKTYNILNIPHQVGGRFSVFSNVGVFPLLALGVDVPKLLAGAQDAFVSAKDTLLPSTYMATDIYNSSQEKSVIHDLFLFDGDLEYLGRWYRQLMAESLGKGGRGMLPTVSVGSTDLHSVAQLYLDGPNNRFTTFLWVNQKQDVKVPENMSINLVSGIAGRPIAHIHEAIYKGTQAAYTKTGRPFNSIKLPNTSERSLGFAMQSLMLVVMALGHLTRVNTFDQPAVELYKAETRKILSN